MSVEDTKDPDPAAEALHDLAETITEEAVQLNPDNPREAGLAEGLGEAAGRAEERARQQETNLETSDADDG
jgi:hypothetical protein